MNTLQKIRKLADEDKKKRRDPRFVKTMALLTSRGFLFANQTFPKIPGLRLKIEDAVWAGLNVEPRILEVLPAIVLRLEKHFDFDPKKHSELANTLEDIRQGKERGRDFLGVPYEKARHWVGFEIRDRRVKPFGEKKILRTYRFKPSTLEKLKKLSAQRGQDETAMIEELISKS